MQVDDLISNPSVWGSVHGGTLILLLWLVIEVKTLKAEVKPLTRWWNERASANANGKEKRHS